MKNSAKYQKFYAIAQAGGMNKTESDEFATDHSTRSNPPTDRQIPVEFGFTAEAFNLVIESTSDGERIAREEERKAVEKAQAAAGQFCLLFIDRNQSQQSN